MKKQLETSFFYLISVGWLVIILLLPLVPASLWYSLNSIEITDQYDENGHRIIQVDREIHRDFKGFWEVEEQILVDAEKGLYTTVRVCYGEANYKADKSLPDPTTQEWWRYGEDNCAWLTPIHEKVKGQYRDCTFVRIKTKFFGEKRVETCSNRYTYKGDDV